MIIQNPDGSYTICPLARPLARRARALIARIQLGALPRLYIRLRERMARPAAIACSACSDGQC